MKNFWLRGRYCLMFTILSVLSVLSACGKTGDLYLPADEVDQNQQPTVINQQETTE